MSEPRFNAPRCKACKDTGVLLCAVIDGSPGRITCGFCAVARSKETKETTDGDN